MPNWCSNRLDITLHNAADMPALKHWIYADDGIPAWQTAIAQSLHLLLAGCAGILKPVRPLSFPPLPELTSYGETGPVSPGNTAFTHWVEMLITAPDLTPSYCQQIHQWYQMWLSEGGVYHSWDSLTATQKARLSPLLSAGGFDWLNRFTGEDEAGLAAVWEDIQYLRGTGEAIPMDMRNLLPTSLAAELHGFNGRLWKTPEVIRQQARWQAFAPGNSSYHLYLCRYGVKWPNGSGFCCIDDGEATTLSVTFDTPWSPPSAEVLCALSARFRCQVRHVYAEEGCGFCGYSEYDHGRLADHESDEIEFSDEENEDGFRDVTGPDYILDSLPHYGG
ncbi:DUF1281 domain-containing protein [Morganella morganii]|uniref:DUF1281 domain-containing protein n=1 Tax=Morganella morganii TaxID=582 RepID=UPI00331489EC